MAALPHAVMGIIVLLGGQLADYLRSHKIFSTTTVRKLFNCGGISFDSIKKKVRKEQSKKCHKIKNSIKLSTEALFGIKLPINCTF